MCVRFEDTSNMPAIPYTVEVIEKLRWNSHLGKHKHFEASLRGRNYHVLCGVPVVLINLFLGSVLFALIGGDLPDWSKWAGAALALVAAFLGGIQTFFNFQREYEGHREVGNEYLAIARECERLLALHFDGFLALNELSQHIESLNNSYEEVNHRAEVLVIRESDYKKALAFQEQKARSEPSLVSRMKADSGND
jgi:hypothetical protein